MFCLGLYQLFGQNCNQTLMDDFEAVSTVKESQSGSFYAVFDKNIIKLTPGIITLLTSRITKVCITGLQAKLRSRPEVFCKKGVLKNFEKIHRKTPVPEPCSQ